eukprot:1143350-Pelagomonas_calceolata.AAC.2
MGRPPKHAPTMGWDVQTWELLCVAYAGVRRFDWTPVAPAVSDLWQAGKMRHSAQAGKQQLTAQFRHGIL